MVCVVLDARVRGSIQTALGQLATTANTATAEGRTRLLGEVSVVLRRHRAAWLYSGAVNHPMASLEEARGSFQRHATGARATYQTETIRNADGRTTTARSEASPRPEKGQGSCS